ncbi:MauE/DoxX family redox-associated membrane protein [Arthrobacter woluwensis]|uniref:MauE/DoxX family redox-associated membrane protein n=1 Tax=Arthrobacter woluwensis TaxID=156980 RepID=UPI0014701932|nr:MauE/DoxX family redox-associated membrane protein [Arthrobacter woluwensis]
MFLDELLTVCRFLVGGFFVWSGSSKFGNPAMFWSQIMGYQITGAGVSRVLAAVIPPLEFMCGLFFASGMLPLVPGIILLILLGVFCIAITVSLVRKADNDCGCGPKSSKVSPLHLVRNALLAALVVAGLFSPPLHYVGDYVVASCGALIIIGASIYRWRMLNR